MSVIETEKATDVIVEYFDLICDTDYAFDETEILRRMNANAIDAVPVIRCKDCEDYKSFKEGGFHHYCETIGCVVYDDDFCCWAERKGESK